jgi:hypothetical protein
LIFWDGFGSGYDRSGGAHLPAISIWWLYRYVDWRNDIYIVTLDSILDIERKP